jgi:class 3 adenylate cyclase
MEQQISYCTTIDGVRIAYATYGNEEAPPLVHLPDAPGQEPIWSSRWGRTSFQALAQHRRLITLDCRRTGASQRDADCPGPESLVADVAAVADHLRLDQFELFAGLGRGPLAVMYAGAYPERIAKLVLFSPSVASTASHVTVAETARASYTMYLRAISMVVFPSGPPEVQRWWYTAARTWESVENVTAALSWTHDLAPLLPHLTMPVLILHRKHAQVAEAAQVRSVASRIPGARLVTLDGDASATYWDSEQYIGTLNDFLGIEVSAHASTAPSGTAVILFTDIANSTSLTERLGDAPFRDASRQLDARLRIAVTDGGGTAIEGKLLGDGVMAVFSSARQAIDAALRCRELSAQGELPLHVGLHAGDVIREEGNVYGGAVNIASRVCGLSAPGEILVSQTVRDLARTSAGVTFEDRGEHALKGIADPVRVFAVRGSE